MHKLIIGAAMLVAASAGSEGSGKPIQLVPMGEFEVRGAARGKFRLDDIEHARAVIAATRAALGATDLFVDYDHALLRVMEKAPNAKAEAAGWIAADSLEARADGIWGVVRWTEAAATEIKDEKYRYLSPLFFPDKDRRVAQLVNAALTNSPAIEELAAVAASTETQTDMMKEIALALGLAEDADAAAIIAAINKMKAKPAEAMTAIAAALGLQATADQTAIVAAAATLKAAGEPDPAKFVPIAAMTALQTQLATINKERGDALIAAAIEAGQLAPAQKDWATSYFAKDEAGFRAWLGNAPVIAASGALLGKKVDPASDELDADELQVIAATGISREDFLKSRKDPANGRA